MSFSNGHDYSAAPDIVADTVVAKRFILTDDEGKRRISLYLAADGSPCVVLHDTEERARLEFLLKPNGRPGIVLRDHEEKMQASLIVQDDDNPYFVLYDHKQQVRASLYIAEDRSALSLYDRQEQNRICLTHEPEEGDAPYIFLFNKDEERQIALTVSPDGSEGLLLQDREGENRAL